MPTGIYLRTEENTRKLKETNRIRMLEFHKKGKTFEELFGQEKAKEIKEKQRLAKLGTKQSEETKQKRSEIALERGIGKWNKGKKQSEETRKKISLNHRKYQTEETKRKIGLTHKGKKLSKEHKQKLSQSHLGKNTGEKNWNWGKGKLRKAENNPNWKGDKIKEGRCHVWVTNHKPKPKLCEFCGKEKDRLEKTKLELANIKNHKYTRNPDDYKWGHHSCHRTFDNENKRKKTETE